MSDDTQIDPAIEAQFAKMKKEIQELQEKSSSVEYTRVYLAVGHDTVLNNKVFVTHVYPKKSNKHHRHVGSVSGDKSVDEVQLLALHSLFVAMAHTDAGSKIKITMKDIGLSTVLSNPLEEATEHVDNVREELLAIGIPVEFSGDEDSPLFEKAGLDIFQTIKENREAANAHSNGSSVCPTRDSSPEDPE